MVGSASTGKKSHEDAHIVLIGAYADGIHLTAVEDVLETGTLLFPPASLCIAHRGTACINNPLFSRLCVIHFQQTDIGQFGYTSVINLNGNDIVLAGCNGEGLQERASVDEVAQHESDAATLDGPGQIFQSKGNVCLLTVGFEIDEFADDVKYVLAAFLRRNELLHLVGEEDDSNLVVVLDGGKSQSGGYLGQHLALGLLLRSEIEAATHVNQQHHGQLALLFKHFDIGLAKACCHVPLNVAYVITVLVLAHLGEGHAAPLKGRVVLASEDVVAQTSGFNLYLPDFL